MSSPQFKPSNGSIMTTVSLNDDYDNGFRFDDKVQRNVVGSLFVLVSLVGTFGNGLVVLAVVLSKKLRTVTNVFVVNLAVADLIVCFVLPWNAVGMFTDPEYGWPLPDGLCVAVALIGFTCVGCSLYTLAAIALNRWMLITRAAKIYRMCYSPAYLAIMLVIVWLVPFLVAFVPPRFGLGELGYAEKYSTCTHKTSNPNSIYYSLLQSVILFPVPFIIIIVCYVKVFMHVKRHLKVMKGRADQSADLHSDAPNSNHNTLEVTTNVSATSSPIKRSRESVAKKRFSRRQVEITKNLFYVVCAFAICITPFAIALLIPPSDPVIPWTGALLLVNSCLNPIIYATKHPHFKKVFRCILLCQYSQIPEQSDILRTVRTTVRRGRSQHATGI